MRDVVKVVCVLAVILGVSSWWAWVVAEGLVAAMRAV